MKKIITLTLNPALDKSIAVPQLVPEKKLKASGAKTEPGGGGINVSRALHKLGVDSRAVYLSGGYTGKQFDTLLAAEGVAAVPLPIKNDMRENFVVLDEYSNAQYRFGMEGPQVEPDEWLDSLQYISEQDDIAYIVASGSLPPGVPADIFGQLAVIAKQKNARLVVDTSGDALKYAVQKGVFLVKPNLSELAGLYGKEKLGKEEIVTAARSMIRKSCCEIMVVSMGGDGAMLVTATEQFQVTPPKQKIQSTVGAGDSMVAGLVAALSKEWELEDVLRYGVAAGSAATLNAGTELCKKEDTERLFAEMKQPAVAAMS
ncbi:MAG: 1-phosphofructokinase family hexose kinase [Chitinophagaceae bacterium]|nr:1-phosphofructokinase family hexose kinase [Chitinophagaceae bacterium]